MARLIRETSDPQSEFIQSMELERAWEAIRETFLDIPKDDFRMRANKKGDGERLKDGPKNWDSTSKADPVFEFDHHQPFDEVAKYLLLCVFPSSPLSNDPISELCLTEESELANIKEAFNTLVRSVEKSTSFREVMLDSETPYAGPTPVKYETLQRLRSVAEILIQWDEESRADKPFADIRQARMDAMRDDYKRVGVQLATLEAIAAAALGDGVKNPQQFRAIKARVNKFLYAFPVYVMQANPTLKSKQPWDSFKHSLKYHRRDFQKRIVGKNTSPFEREKMSLLFDFRFLFPELKALFPELHPAKK